MSLEQIIMSQKLVEKPARKEEKDRGLMTIREMSALTGVPPHTLRFWEKQMPDVLSPERTPGGQRRYGPESVERVRAIRYLSDEKRYPLAVIRKHLAGESGIPISFGKKEPQLRDEQAVDLIVDEIACLLKEKLLDMLKNGEMKNGFAPTSAGSTPPPSKGGNDHGHRKPSE